MDQEGGGNCNTITRYHINAEGGDMLRTGIF